MSVLGLVLTLATFPAQALAVTSPEPVASPSAAGFCTKLPADEQAISEGLNNRITTMDKNRETHANNLASQRAKFDETVTANRAKWDTERQQNFTALQNKATTDTQKAAVTTFEQTVLGLVQTHRSTIDAARDTFRAGEDQLIAGRQSEVNTAVSDFQSAINQTESSAAASCQAGTKSATVRQAFISGLRTDRSNFQSALSQIQPIEAAVKSLATTRTDAVQAADTSFTSGVKAAGQILKTALHQT